MVSIYSGQANSKRGAGGEGILCATATGGGRGEHLMLWRIKKNKITFETFSAGIFLPGPWAVAGNRPVTGGYRPGIFSLVRSITKGVKTSHSQVS